MLVFCVQKYYSFTVLFPSFNSSKIGSCFGFRVIYRPVGEINLPVPKDPISMLNFRGRLLYPLIWSLLYWTNKQQSSGEKYLLKFVSKNTLDAFLNKRFSSLCFRASVKY